MIYVLKFTRGVVSTQAARQWADADRRRKADSGIHLRFNRTKKEIPVATHKTKAAVIGLQADSKGAGEAMIIRFTERWR